MPIDKLAWIFIRDGKVLFTRSKGKDVYYIPGGKREAGESDQEALMREIKEELGVELLPNALSYIETFEAQAHGKPEGVMVRMTCYGGDFTGELQPNSEVEEIVWLTHRDKLKTGPVDQMILDWLREKNLIE